jgi:hypothetical protein
LGAGTHRASDDAELAEGFRPLAEVMRPSATLNAALEEFDVEPVTSGDV